MDSSTGMADLLSAIPLKKTQSPFSRSSQWSTGPQLGVGTSETDLISCNSHAGPRSCCEFINVVHLSCPGDTVLLWCPLASSLVFLLLLPCCPWLGEDGTDVPLVAELSALWQIVSFFIIYGSLYKWTSLYGLRAALKYGFGDIN